MHQAAMEGWDATRLQGEVYKTDYWKSSTEASRRWDALVATDPNSAWQQVARSVPQIKAMLTNLGVDVTADRVQDLVLKALKWGWSTEEIQRAAASELSWDPSRDLSGHAADGFTQIKRLANDYGINVSDKGTFGLARRMLMGDVDQAWINDFLRDKAKQTFAHFSDELDRGLTIREIADPYVQSAAQLLEIDPERIDIADPKYRRALSRVGPDGKRSAMDLLEWQTTLMNDQRYGWDKTRNAREQAVNLVGSLAETFGVR